MSLADDIEIEPKGRYRKKNSASNNFWWTTKNGTNIFIGDMTDKHILNTINKFGENNVPNCMLFEALRRGILNKE